MTTHEGFRDFLGKISGLFSDKIGVLLRPRTAENFGGFSEGHSSENFGVLLRPRTAKNHTSDDAVGSLRGGGVKP